MDAKSKRRTRYLLALTIIATAYLWWSHVRYEVEYVNLIDADDPRSQIVGWQPGMITKEEALRQALRSRKLNYSSTEPIPVELVSGNCDLFPIISEVLSEYSPTRYSGRKPDFPTMGIAYVVTIPVSYEIGHRKVANHAVLHGDPISIILDPWTGEAISFFQGLKCMQEREFLQESVLF